MQAGHDSFRAVPTLPIPSTSKQQFPQQQVGKYGLPRKTIVKISHPDTGEELRLYKSTDSYNVPPQSQPIPATGLCGEKVAHESSKFPRPHVETSLNTHQRDSEVSSRSSLPPSKLVPEPTTLLPLASEQSAGTSTLVSSESLAASAFSSAPTPVDESASVVVSSHEGRSETIRRSESIKGQQKKPGEKGHSEPQDQVFMASL